MLTRTRYDYDAPESIAYTFDFFGEHFELNPTRFIDLRRFALRKRGRLLCR